MKKFFTTIWNEIVFVYTELKKTLSNEPSFFSSKRIERAILFLTAIVTSNVWFWSHYPNLDVNEIALYIGIHLGYAGFTMSQSQKEKKFNNKLKEKNEDGESKNG